MKITLSMRVENNNGVTSTGQTVKPDILIGADYCWELTDLGLRRTWNAFYVVPTKMGKVAAGKQTNASSEDIDTNKVIACYTLPNSITRFSASEAKGIKESLNINDDDVPHEQFYKNLAFKKQRFVVSWSNKNINCFVE